MRGKRSKAYKKLMTQYHHVFGFREPYQVLVDSAMVVEVNRCAMVANEAFERTVRGTVKPMITQCSIRHLYALDATEHPHKDRIIETAKTFERRKCGHHELENPLPELECFNSVVNKNGENRHHYCVAAQDREIRNAMREIPGVPLIGINRSVMILEPMTEASLRRRDGLERKKFRDGIMDARQAVGKTSSAAGLKRKRPVDGEEDAEKVDEEEEGEGKAEEQEKKKKKRKGPKGPNPLAVKKKKPSTAAPGAAGAAAPKAPKPAAGGDAKDGEAKKKRKRKHGHAKAGEGASEPAPAPATTEASA